MTVHQIGDLELQQDLEFQRKEWKVQRVGWVVMALILAAALLGLFGGIGPLSQAIRGSTEEGLSLVYHRFSRYSQPETITLHVNHNENPVQVWLSTGYVENVQIEHVLPEPDRVEASSDRVVYMFQRPEPGQPVSIIFHLKPDRIGSLTGQVGIEGGPALSFSQFIYP